MTTDAQPGPGGALARRLGTGDAVVIGLGSMLGAGVFASFAPAARASGGWLPLALAIGAVAAKLIERGGVDRLSVLHAAIDVVRRGGTVSILLAP